MPTQVLKFQITRFLEGKDILRQHASVAHDYYKKLVVLHRGEILRKDRVMHRFEKSRLDPVEERIDILSDSIDDIYKDIKKARQEASYSEEGIKPTKVEATEEQKEQIETLKKQRQACYQELGQIKAEFQADIDKVNDLFEARSRDVPIEVIREHRELGKQLSKAKRVKKKNRDAALITSLEEQIQPLQEIINGGKRTMALNKNREVIFAQMREEDWPLQWKLYKYIDLDVIRRTNDMSDFELTHGTYSTVRENIRQAKKSKKKRLPDPDKVHWKGGRKVGVQLQGPDWITQPRLFEGVDNRLSITEVTSLKGRSKRRRGRPKMKAGSIRSKWKNGICHMNLGKDTHLSFEVLMHRSIPKDAVITWAFVVPRKQGLRTTYSLQLTVNVEKPLIQRAEGKGDLILRLGWTREKPVSQDQTYRGLIVASSEDGQQENITVPGIVYEKIDYEDALKSKRDEMFKNKEKALHHRGVAQQLKVAFKKTPELFPKWFRDPENLKASKRLDIALRQWMLELCDPADDRDGFKRLLRLKDGSHVDRKELFKRWKRFRGIVNRKNERGSRYQKDTFVLRRQILTDWLISEGITEPHLHWAIWLDWWKIKRNHLYTLACDKGCQARRQRKDFYRCVAAELAMKYKTVGVLELEIAELAKRKTPDKDDKELHQKARRQRGIAGLYELKSCLEQAFGKKRFREVKREKSANEAA